MIDLTIIIPALNKTQRTKYALEQCLTSLIETVPEVPIVVSTNNGKPEPLPVESPNIKRIHVWEQGQCKATNAAIATTNTEWIMISNDDMIYPPKWLEELNKYTRVSEFNYPCISPVLVEPMRGAPTFLPYNCGGAGGDFDKEKFLMFVARYKAENPWKTRIENGFNLPFLIKRKLWDLIESYDIKYDPFGSNSDSDLEYKIRLAGVQPMQNRNCLVYHFSQTSGTSHADNRAYWNQNWNYFIKKWGFERVGGDEIWRANFKIDYKKLKYRPKWMKLPQE